VETPRQRYGDQDALSAILWGQDLRAVILRLLERIEKFQFAAARILGLSGKIMGPVTACELNHNFAVRQAYGLNEFEVSTDWPSMLIPRRRALCELGPSKGNAN